MTTIHVTQGFKNELDKVKDEGLTYQGLLKKMLKCYIENCLEDKTNEYGRIDREKNMATGNE